MHFPAEIRLQKKRPVCSNLLFATVKYSLAVMCVFFEPKRTQLSLWNDFRPDRRLFRLGWRARFGCLPTGGLGFPVGSTM